MGVLYVLGTIANEISEAHFALPNLFPTARSAQNLSISHYPRLVTRYPWQGLDGWFYRMQPSVLHFNPARFLLLARFLNCNHTCLLFNSYFWSRSISSCNCHSAVEFRTVSRFFSQHENVIVITYFNLSTYIWMA